MGTELINTKHMHLDEENDYGCFEIKSYFIHSVHPLGFFRKLEVSVDDEKVDVDNIFFVVRGNWIPARYMPTNIGYLVESVRKCIYLFKETRRIFQGNA